MDKIYGADKLAIVDEDKIEDKDKLKSLTGNVAVMLYNIDITRSQVSLWRPPNESRSG